MVQDVFQQYMRENYFTSRGIGKSSSALNVAACRLVLDIMPGLETAVLHGTEGLVSQLYKWVEEGEDPLASYAIGLLAVAMELNEVAKFELHRAPVGPSRPRRLLDPHARGRVSRVAEFCESFMEEFEEELTELILADKTNLTQRACKERARPPR